MDREVCMCVCVCGARAARVFVCVCVCVCVLHGLCPWWDAFMYATFGSYATWAIGKDTAQVLLSHSQYLSL